MAKRKTKKQARFYVMWGAVVDRKTGKVVCKESSSPNESEAYLHYWLGRIASALNKSVVR